MVGRLSYPGIPHKKIKHKRCCFTARQAEFFGRFILGICTTASMHEKNLTRGTLLMKPVDDTRIIRMYKNYVTAYNTEAKEKGWPEEERLGDTTVRILVSQKLFGAASIETCADPQEVQFGWENQVVVLNLLTLIKENMEWGAAPAGRFEDYDDLVVRAKWAFTFVLQGGYKFHCEKESNVFWHCGVANLSHPMNGAYYQECTHPDCHGKDPVPLPVAARLAPAAVNASSCVVCGEANTRKAGVQCKHCSNTVHLTCADKTTFGRPSPPEHYRCSDCAFVTAPCPDSPPPHSSARARALPLPPAGLAGLIARNHDGSCAECEAMFRPFEDIIRAVEFCIDATDPAAADDDAETQRKLGRREALVSQLKTARRAREFFQRLVGHVHRGKWQDRFREGLLPDMPWWEFYLLHDFWKKFAAVQKIQVQCENQHSNSVESFVIMGYVPPADTPGVKWEIMPEGCRDRADRRAKRARREEGEEEAGPA